MLLSKEHGLNPTIPVCFFCGEAKNEIALTGRAGEKAARAMGREDGEMPIKCCLDHTPCDDCAEHMKQGILLISTRDGEEGKDNPYRTGGLWVVKDEAIDRIVASEELAEQIKQARFCFIPDAACDAIGLVKGSAEVSEA